MPQSKKSPSLILVVEDFEDTRQMIALELRSRGYEVVEAADGRQALEAARRRRPDLVIMDLSLPVLDGLSAVYRMRETEAMCGVPVIACTAHGADIHLAAARAVGCDEYLTKPVDLGRLNELVSRLLARPRSACGHAAHAAMSDDELTSYIDGLMG